MTETYRKTELENASREYSKARESFAAAKNRKQKLAADEQMQFWGNKVSFLSAVRFCN